MNDLAKTSQIEESLLTDLTAETSLSNLSQLNYRSDIRQFNEYLDETGQTLTPESIERYFQAIQDQYKPTIVEQEKIFSLTSFETTI